MTPDNSRPDPTPHEETSRSADPLNEETPATADTSRPASHDETPAAADVSRPTSHEDSPLAADTSRSAGTSPHLTEATRQDDPPPSDRTPLDDWTGSVEADSTTPESAADRAAKGRAARLFDIRRIIGGLFLVYGVILVITGIVDGNDAVTKAEGIRVNLWTGIGMIVVAGVFIGWERLRPVEISPSEDDPAT
ncbi:hypothetical protein GCM10009677_43190 [Sphaerisporangium rubeum]|uniref:Uncharacterized protein n=1 Tax=Sphaerisporangium rubeum TaxID=321317 RepID=A0A7X0IH14_9ACTN|nr:hypothetical protein [Sphaerisporangium rubeum]MBB6474788.1 hypothetical protein [Sphaerisporangium rubeum]